MCIYTGSVKYTSNSVGLRAVVHDCRGGGRPLARLDSLSGSERDAP